MPSVHVNRKAGRSSGAGAKKVEVVERVERSKGPRTVGAVVLDVENALKKQWRKRDKNAVTKAFIDEVLFAVEGFFEIIGRQDSSAGEGGGDVDDVIKLAKMVYQVINLIDWGDADDDDDDDDDDDEDNKNDEGGGGGGSFPSRQTKMSFESMAKDVASSMKNIFSFYRDVKDYTWGALEEKKGRGKGVRWRHRDKASLRMCKCMEVVGDAGYATVEKLKICKGMVQRGQGDEALGMLRDIADFYEFHGNYAMFDIALGCILKIFQGDKNCGRDGAVLADEALRLEVASRGLCCFKNRKTWEGMFFELYAGEDGKLTREQDGEKAVKESENENENENEGQGNDLEKMNLNGDADRDEKKEGMEGMDVERLNTTYCYSNPFSTTISTTAKATVHVGDIVTVEAKILNDLERGGIKAKFVAVFRTFKEVLKKGKNDCRRGTDDTERGERVSVDVTLAKGLNIVSFDFVCKRREHYVLDVIEIKCGKVTFFEDCGLSWKDRKVSEGKIFFF